MSLERAARFPHVMVIRAIAAIATNQNASPEAGMETSSMTLNRATNPIAFEAVASIPATIEEAPE